MTEMPSGWTLASLSDLAGHNGLMTDGDWVESKDQDPNGAVRLIQLADIGDGVFLDKSSRFLTAERAKELQCTFLNEGDLLIARMPDPLGRACIFPGVGKKAVTAVDVCIWRKGETDVETSWLKYAINSPQIREEISLLASGTTRLRISGGNLKRLKVRTPPIAEQRRISSTLDRFFSRSKSAYDELARVQRLAERYKQAILEAAFRGDLTAAWRPADVIRPAEWNRVHLDEIADVATGATPKRGNPRFYQNGTVPWITSKAVNRTQIESAEEMITEAALRETNCKVFPIGTLVMAMYGEGQTRGRVSRLEIPAATNQALAAITIQDTAQVSPDFLLWFLRSSYSELRNMAAGGVQPNLNLGMVKAIAVPLPSTVEQVEIARRIERMIDSIDAAANESDRAAVLLDRLERAALAKAFRGELVPQDPADEPVSVQSKGALAPTERPSGRPSRAVRRSSRTTHTNTKKGGPMGKKRTNVSRDHLTKSLQALGGRAEAGRLWQRSEMDIDEFYKQLRDEIDAGRIEEDGSKERLKLANAT